MKKLMCKIFGHKKTSHPLQDCGWVEYCGRCLKYMFAIYKDRGPGSHERNEIELRKFKQWKRLR